MLFSFASVSQQTSLWMFFIVSYLWWKTGSEEDYWQQKKFLQVSFSWANKTKTIHMMDTKWKNIERQDVGELFHNISYTKIKSFSDDNVGISCLWYSDKLSLIHQSDMIRIGCGLE